MTQRLIQTPSVLLIAETRPTVAVGLKVFLADIPGTQPVTIMTGFDDVVDYAEKHEIGLIIVGQGSSWATPLSEFRRLRQKNPTWRLVLLADRSDRETIMAGLAAGASGIIPTSIEPQELNAVVNSILAGGIYIPSFSDALEQQHAGRPLRDASSTPRPSLTPRQSEVLEALAEGHSNKQIARLLKISYSTVSMHLNAAFHALGVHNRSSAVLAYRQLGGTGAEPQHAFQMGRRFPDSVQRWHEGPSIMTIAPRP